MNHKAEQVCHNDLQQSGLKFVPKSTYFNKNNYYKVLIFLHFQLMDLFDIINNK